MTTNQSYYYSTNPYSWLEPTPTIFLFLGLTVLTYGISRLINNVLKLMIRKNSTHRESLVNRYLDQLGIILANVERIMVRIRLELYVQNVT